MFSKVERMFLVSLIVVNSSFAGNEEKLPVIDISDQAHRHVIIAAGTERIYQGHPTTRLVPRYYRKWKGRKTVFSSFFAW